MVYIHPSTDVDTLTLSAKDSNSLVLGNLTAEGGNILGYRDLSGNTGFSVDMDAASNVKGLYCYAGGIFENYLTIGKSTLDTSANLYVKGNIISNTGYTMNGTHFLVLPSTANSTIDLKTHYGDISITPQTHISTSKTTQVNLGGHTGDILVLKQVGTISSHTDSAGFFGVTPQTQQAHIIDVAAAAGDPATKAEFDAFATKFNTLLADLEGYGLLLTS